MHAFKRSIVLVTPVWNDSRRLEGFGFELAKALAASEMPIRWIIADDGSSADEKAKLQDLLLQFTEVYPRLEIMFFEERSRKGGAIYRAWDACPDADILAFVDADGAVDAETTIALIHRAQQCSPGVVVAGIRHDDEDTPVRRSLMRAITFRLFGFIVHTLVGISCEDTQCGAKAVPGAAYRAVANQLFEKGFVFDVELLVALGRHDCQIEEFRIPWREIPGGKVHPWQDAWGMLAGLIRVRKRLKAGVYG